MRRSNVTIIITTPINDRRNSATDENAPSKNRKDTIRSALVSEFMSSCLTPELSDSRPAVVMPVTLDYQSAPPKSATLELHSGGAVRSSDLVSPSFHCSFV